jgi:hypothetical protein
LSFQKFPYPPGKFDFFIHNHNFYLSLSLMLIYMFNCNEIVNYIVSEKEKRLKQTMQIMGVNVSCICLISPYPFYIPLLVL